MLPFCPCVSLVITFLYKKKTVFLVSLYDKNDILKYTKTILCAHIYTGRVREPMGDRNNETIWQLVSSLI